MGRLDGKIILITGGGAGIGRAAALLCAQEGAKVAIAELRPELAEATAAAIAAAGGEALALPTDVAEERSVAAAIAAAVARFGGLDVLYNNAGGATARDGKITELPLDEFWRTIKVDLFGTFLACRLAMPHLVTRGGGAIINTTSVRALIGTAGADAYTAAKGGVLALTRALALQWAEHGIRVNAIAPGLVLSERVRGLVDPGSALYRRSALGPAEPADVAHLAVYLASDEARRVTGTVLPVDSGLGALLA